MIDLSQTKIDDTPEQITEGSLTTAIKSAAKDMADIDVDAYKDATKGQTGGILNTNIQAALNDNVLDPARSTLDAIAKNLGKDRVDNRSIIARAKNSIVQFPIYVTQTLRPNHASIIARQFERYYVTVLQTVIAQHPIIDESEANDLMFLKRWHSNINEAAQTVGVELSRLYNEFYEPIDDNDRLMRESMFYTQRISENCVVEFRVIPTTDQDLIMENARLAHEPLTGFTYIKEETTSEALTRARASSRSGVEITAKNSTLTDDDFRDMAIDRIKSDPSKRSLTSEDERLIKSTDSEIKSNVDNAFPYDKGNVLQKRAHDSELRKRITRRDGLLKTIDKEIDSIKDDIKAGKVRKCAWDGSRYVRQDVTQHSGKGDSAAPPVSVPTILKDGDIKKTNDMLPYTMEVMFRIRSKNGLERDVRYIIGVKSILHIVRAQDLADDLQELITGKIKSLQKVRYKTGELSFKDYFFNLKGAKADAAKHINRNKRWVNNLKHLAAYNSTYGSYLAGGIKMLTNGNVPIPNATLVLTQTDVTALTGQTGIDLSVVSNAKRLGKNLFLLAICIIDASEGTMRVLFIDDSDDWAVESLASIDAELKKTENSQLLAELNKIINK